METRDDKILKGFYKQSADKIIQILDKVKEDKEKNIRRWVWELMQNAKDAKNRFDKVNISIFLSQTKLIFSHNGNPFSEDNLISLAQQVSSKDSDNEDEEVTGKFGTGFISTHLLSNIIYINGYLKLDNKKHYKFKLPLNRQAESSEELIPLLESLIEKIRRLDNDPDFIEENLYEEKRKADDLHTSFTYPLINEFSKTAARKGIEDLLNTLPITLIFLEKIGNVQIVNEVDDVIEDYTCKIEKEEKLLSFYKVTKNSSINDSTSFYFIKWKQDDVQIVVQVNNFSELALIDNNGKIPILYRDFPLIGSEKFHFPFYFNGSTFHPTENRDGVLIKGDGKKPEHNKELLLKARDCGIEFTKWLLGNNASNLYILANTRIPFVPDINEETKRWLKEYQIEWRKAIIDFNLVETKNGKTSIRNAKVPFSNCGLKKEDSDNLYPFAVELLGEDRVPGIDILHDWIKIFEPSAEYDTWEASVLYNEEHILSSFEEQSLESLIFGKDEITNDCQKIKWLNNFFKHLGRYKKLELLDEYSVVPNQYGNFSKISQLWWEKKDDQIPDEILDVLKTLEKDWRTTMVHRNVSFEGLPKRENGLAEASKEINTILVEEKKEKGKIVYDFNYRINAKEILTEILRLITDNIDKNSFRYKTFEFSKEFFAFAEDFKLVNNLQTFSFDKASELMIKLLNESIEKSLNVSGLSKILNKDLSQSIIWLNSYLEFLQNSQKFNYLIKYGNIVPNREHDNKLCAFEDLYNYGTKEQELNDELIKILKEFDSKQDWNEKLVSDGISINLPNTYKFDELGNAINQIVDSIRINENEENFRDQLLSLIEWCNKNDKLAKHYLSEFVEKAIRIFFILTVEKSKHSGDIVKLMKQPEKLADLVKLAESGINLQEISAIAEIAKDPKQMQKIKKYAVELEEEKQEFKFKLQIGRTVEEYFEDILESERLNAEVKYKGSGSHDFVIKNPANNKEFFIELKSHKHGDKKTPIKLAISQVRLAVNESTRFGLCVLERPQRDNSDIYRYIKQNLKYLGGLGTDFQRVVAKAKVLDEIIRDPSSISIELKDIVYGVKVSHDYLEARCKPFQELIQKIKVVLQ